MGSVEAGTFVRDALMQNPRADLGRIAADLVTLSLSKGSYDNITVMVVHLAEGADWSSYPDEMVNFDKWVTKASQMNSQVQDKHVDFLRRAKFPLIHKPCDKCGR